jgi:hypothetical protein
MKQNLRHLKPNFSNIDTRIISAKRKILKKSFLAKLVWNAEEF